MRAEEEDDKSPPMLPSSGGCVAMGMGGRGGGRVLSVLPALVYMTVYARRGQYVCVVLAGCVCVWMSHVNA